MIHQSLFMIDSQWAYSYVSGCGFHLCWSFYMGVDDYADNLDIV